MKPYYADATVTVHHGDCLDVLATLPDASVDAVVTDPPYGLEFMGKEWDRFGGEIVAATDTGTIGRQSSTPFAGGDQRIRFGAPGLAFQSWCQTWAAECLRILKPGGHLLAFGGTRTSHRLTCAIEDAGFEIRDSIAWLYGSGFPKSLDVSKAIDRAAGVEREVVGTYVPPNGSSCGDVTPHARTPFAGGDKVDGIAPGRDVTAPATDAAHQWQGWGTALKPAHEPITVARKPLAGTVAANVQAWGTGALNVDGCRVEGVPPSVPQPDFTKVHGERTRLDSYARNGEMSTAPAGRWPANVVLDEDAAAELDRQSGDLVDRNGGRGGWRETYVDGHALADTDTATYRDTGGASRFFYTAKAGSAERIRHDGIAHPTVKPLSLMRWLVRLITPPGGIVLDPFAGSGTTAEAAILEGFRCIAIEREAEYLPLITQRINRRRDPVAYVRAAGSDGPASLFDLDGGAA